MIYRDSDNYYHILGLNNGATLKEIKKTYRALIKVYHNDTAYQHIDISALPPSFDDAIKVINETFRRLTEHETIIKEHGAIHGNVNKLIELEDIRLLDVISTREEQALKQMQETL